MGTVGDVAERTSRTRKEHRRDHGHVGEVRAAREGIVQDDDVARPHRHAREGGPNGERSRPKVHGNVRRMRHQVATRVEQRA